MNWIHPIPIWSVVLIALVVPAGAAAMSPLLEWRDPVYIVAGFAGIAAMTLLLVQPLLACGYLPGISRTFGRRIHRWVGSLLLLLVLVHVIALWITSPPDVVDALLFVSPTPFSLWGVIAMWGVLITASLAVLRRQLGIRPRTWRIGHKSLAVVIVVGTVVHVVLIDGTMEIWSKYGLCAVVVMANIAMLINSLSRYKSTRV